MQVAIFTIPMVTTPPTANDVTTASIPSTAGAVSAHCRQQIQMAQLQVIPFPLYQPMEH
jgi:hypothetical protein